MENIKETFVVFFIAILFIIICLLFIWLTVIHYRCKETCNSYNSTVYECNTKIVKCKMKNDCIKSLNVRKN